MKQYLLYLLDWLYCLYCTSCLFIIFISSYPLIIWQKRNFSWILIGVILIYIGVSYHAMSFLLQITCYMMVKSYVYIPV